MIPLKASDCVSPAFRHTVRQLFQPFRFAFWLRMALLGFITGELAAGGGCNFDIPSPSQRPSGSPSDFPWHLPTLTPGQIAVVVAGAIAAFLVIALIMMYLNSVLRFVLFDSILTGDTRIIEGWKKRRDIGRRYFVWQLILAAISIAMAVLLIVLPVVLLISRGVLKISHFEPRVILYLLPGVLAFMLYSLAMAVVAVLAKDFMVPMMALEGIGWREGWLRVWGIVKATPGDYAIYLLLKIGLRIVAAIGHGIVAMIVMLIFAIPVVLLVIVGIAIGAGATMVVKALLITIGVAVGLVFLLFLMALSAFVGVPISYFFPSYSVFFFASRYEPLRRIVYPAPPQPPPAADGRPEPPPAIA